MNYNTKPRKLEKQEHIKTRKLWEDVFKEDTKEFLDYYYNEDLQNFTNFVGVNTDQT